MLKFFNNVRYKLMTQNHSPNSKDSMRYNSKSKVWVGRYFKYAIGEILLVVIGILIALQVNNWNSQKTEHRISKEYHQRIISDIDQMTESLESEVNRANKINQNLSNAVQILLKKEFNDSTYRILDYAFKRYFQLSALSFQITSYEEMKSTGRLNLIYNINLRQKLNAYSSYAYVVSSIVDQFSKNLNGQNDLFNQYIRILPGVGANVLIDYSAETISKDITAINTLSRFAYDWDSYKYFLELMITELGSLKSVLVQELNMF